MMFDDKVGGWEWLNDDVIKKYTYKVRRKQGWNFFKKKTFFMQKLFYAGTIQPNIDDLGPLRLEDSETEDDETITEPGSDTMPIISVKTYLKSIYPFEDITDQFNSSD